MRSPRQKALGQNFLHHRPTIQKILDLTQSEFERAPRKPRALVEVGPGRLALTKGLLDLARAKQVPLYLVERDRQLEDPIREELGEALESGAVELHFMDAGSDRFTEFLSTLPDLGRTPFFFASNLPYSAASPILANLCHESSLMSGAVVMVQKEVGDRMAAQVGDGGDRGSFSLLLQSYFTVRKAFDVGPGAFNPPPKVMSSVLRLEPLDEPATRSLKDPRDFERFCQMLFSQRRKMIRGSFPKEFHQVFPKLGISGTERPEVLDLSVLIELYRHWAEGK